MDSQAHFYRPPVCGNLEFVLFPFFLFIYSFVIAQGKIRVCEVCRVGSGVFL